MDNTSPDILKAIEEVFPNQREGWIYGIGKKNFHHPHAVLSREGFWGRMARKWVDGTKATVEFNSSPGFSKIV